MADGAYLVFAWKPTGYELREEQGDPPKPGETVELDGKQLSVMKVATSPLPSDDRMCVYLQG